jgi:carboxypeptidase Taq
MSVAVRCGAEAALWTRARTICRLRSAAALLTWDQHTALPAGAHASRARQLAEIERVSSEQLGDPEVTVLLDELEAAADADDADTPALVRVLRREHDKARLVPVELRVEIAGAVSESLEVWSAARRSGSFDDFAPALERQVRLRRRYAACFPDVGEPYDVCVDDFDPGARTRDVEATLGALKERLVPMAAALRGRGPAPCPVTGPFPAGGQRALATELLRAAGLDLDRARLAVAAHPMTIAIDRDDVGVAMRFRDDNLDGVWLALHELGHALYEQGFDARLAGSPLAQGASASWHEAQASAATPPSSAMSPGGSATTSPLRAGRAPPSGSSRARRGRASPRSAWRPTS